MGEGEGGTLIVVGGFGEVDQIGVFHAVGMRTKGKGER